MRGDDDAMALETRDWIESLQDVLALRGRDRAAELFRELAIAAQGAGVELPVAARTPYVNTIPADREPPYPGDEAIEARLESLVRWNAMAMVHRANRETPGIGGHISTFASIATLYEVGFHHFFRGPDHPTGADLIYFQGHASPGNYARSYLEGRLDEEDLLGFRLELAEGGGLSSYPHPWLMPEYWQFPTVSMGLGPLQAIYQARFQRYLEDRGLVEPSDRRTWCFVGDGECDEPESLGSIGLAARERLDNLIFVVNCNLQRLDGPVRGNSKIVQELEGIFRGAGWNVIKVLWSREWDDLLARDASGRLARRMEETVDGEYQRAAVEGPAFWRERFFAGDPVLEAMVEGRSDEDLARLRFGGHDRVKVHAAYRAAVRHRGAPTAILAKTVKGYGLGEAGEGRNVTHQQKKLNERELFEFRDRFEVPISDAEVSSVPFHRPAADSPEGRYLRERREALGGPLPRRKVSPVRLEVPAADFFAEFAKGSERPVATTMAFVRMLSKLLRHESLGRRLVPIIPDEARTFGMDALFRQIGIYSHVGQVYEPVDAKNLLFYKEAKDGQILEEGITEAGSMASFLAAGTAHANHGVATIPVFCFYSMFGFQRIGDLIWAAGDARARGFLVGATAGRTTLAGEGLQHQDGQSHVHALALPNLLAYDPAFAYEIAVIVEDGLRRIVERDEDVLCYLTVGNEPYPQPPMPEGSAEGILAGLYRVRSLEEDGDRPRVQLLGSGAILLEVLAAQELLGERFGVAADVWSVTSWKALHADALRCERWNMLHPDRPARRSFVERRLGETAGPIVAATDWLKALPGLLGRHAGRPIRALGTDGFGRSDDRPRLREWFEVDRRFVALAALHELAREGRLGREDVARAIEELEIDPEKPDPMST